MGSGRLVDWCTRRPLWMTRCNFFLLITSHYDVLEKDFLKTNKNGVRFLIRDPPPSLHSKKKQVASKTSLSLHTRGGLAATARKRCNNYFTKTSFLQISWSCPQAYLRATDFLATIWQHITGFILVLTRKPKNGSKRVWIGPKHNLFHFKSLCRCLSIDSWSRVHTLYAGKDCNGNPISTLPPCYAFQMI